MAGPTSEVSDGNQQRDDAQECSKAAVADRRFQSAVGDEDNVIGLQDRVRVLAVQDALYVELDDGAMVANGANEANVIEFALEADSAAQRSCFHQRQRGVLRQGDGSRGFEGAEHVDHADAADDDGVTGKDRDIGEPAVERIGAEVDYERFSETGAADGNDVARGGWKAAGDGENIKQPARADNGHDLVDFADDCRDLVGAFNELDRDLRVAVDSSVLEALLEDLFGLRDGETLQLDRTDKWQQDSAVGSDPDLGAVIGLLEDAHGDEVAGGEHWIASRRKQQSTVCRHRGRCRCRDRWPRTAELSETCGGPGQRKHSDKRE